MSCEDTLGTLGVIGPLSMGTTKLAMSVQCQRSPHIIPTLYR
jgi:hypothetical protein